MPSRVRSRAARSAARAERLAACARHRAPCQWRSRHTRSGAPGCRRRRTALVANRFRGLINERRAARGKSRAARGRGRPRRGVAARGGGKGAVRVAPSGAPADRRGDFNGTVVIEWLNVSGGADGDPGFMYNWEEISREGYAWVGVSAHAAGVVGGGFALGQAMPSCKRIRSATGRSRIPATRTPSILYACCADRPRCGRRGRARRPRAQAIDRVRRVAVGGAARFVCQRRAAVGRGVPCRSCDRPD